MKAENNKFYTELYRCIKSLKIGDLVDDDLEELLLIFSVTKNPLIRNHIALIFSDLKFNKALPFIIDKIKDISTMDDRGTLIYALQALDSKDYFLEYVKIICEMDYESRLMAFELINDYNNKIPEELKMQSLELLYNYKKALLNSKVEISENSTLHFIEKTIELLESNDQT